MFLLRFQKEGLLLLYTLAFTPRVTKSGDVQSLSTGKCEEKPAAVPAELLNRDQSAHFRDIGFCNLCFQVDVAIFCQLHHIKRRLTCRLDEGRLPCRPGIVGTVNHQINQEVVKRA